MLQLTLTILLNRLTTILPCLRRSSMRFCVGHISHVVSFKWPSVTLKASVMSGLARASETGSMAAYMIRLSPNAPPRNGDLLCAPSAHSSAM
jgi:hypothetical protein